MPLKRHEVQVMAENGQGQMFLVDRCVIQAKDGADAAKRYARLFVSREQPGSDTRWQPENPEGHAPYCADPFHSLARYCEANEEEPQTLRGEPSAAWHKDHPEEEEK
jgi:hypothetical protein